LAAKFEIGDRVKCISPPDGNADFVGKNGTVETLEFNGSLPVEVAWDYGFDVTHSHWWCDEEDLEPEIINKTLQGLLEVLDGS